MWAISLAGAADRPHFSLKGMTPLEYYRSSYLGASQSNML
jgi:hypothetical protein